MRKRLILAALALLWAAAQSAQARFIAPWIT